MWVALNLLGQIIFIFIKNLFEKNADEKQRQDSLRAEAKSALAARDADRMADILDRMRRG